ncbi:MAG: hypothetical protein PHV05_02980 [Candidatus Riflebacteria bacterium]|nr:hypothetical protein [Candidatus Riflebacteria bacterium]
MSLYHHMPFENTIEPEVKAIKKIQKIFSLMFLLGIFGFVSIAFAGSTWPERAVPPGVCADSRIVEVVASESTTLLPYWNRTKIVIGQANGVSEKFRVAIGTSTVDTDLPMLTSYEASFKGSVFLAVQTATATAKLNVSQFQE